MVWEGGSARVADTQKDGAGVIYHFVEVEAGEVVVRGPEGLGIRVTDPGHEIPVVARAAGKGQRRARRDDVQAPLRVEHVREWEQVELVGAAAMVEDDQAC